MDHGFPFVRNLRMSTAIFFRCVINGYEIILRRLVLVLTHLSNMYTVEIAPGERLCSYRENSPNGKVYGFDQRSIDPSTRPKTEMVHNSSSTTLVRLLSFGTGTA